MAQVDVIESGRLALEKFEARVARERAELENQLKQELIEYIVKRFSEVAYRMQPLSLKSETKEWPGPGGEKPHVSGTDNPSKRFSVMGIKKAADGEIRFYVEKRRWWTSYEKFEENVYRIDKDCQLRYDSLVDIATALKGYHSPVYMDGNWWRYDSL